MLPRARLNSSYRTEEVNLQPGGSTINVTVPSDNPFELADEIEIVTQASGGMAGADPRMRSRSVVYANKAGSAKHLTRGFLPGMGDGEEFELGLQGAVRSKGQSGKIKTTKRQPRIVHAVTSSAMPTRGFMPGMGDLDPYAAAAIPAGSPSASAAFAPTAPAAPAVESKPFDWDKFATGVGKVAEAGAGTAVKLQQARTDREIAAAGATSEQARAAQARAQADAANAAALRSGMRPSGMGTGAKVGIGLGAVAVIGVIAFLVLRKK